MTPRRPITAAIATLILLAATLASLPAQEKSVRPGINDNYREPKPAEFVERFEREGREIYSHRDAIADACGLAPGMAVADVGAGTGLFTRMFARRVGPAGRVYARDIAETFVTHISNTCAAAGLANVSAAVCAQDDARLPAESVDLAFICDTYHHFEFPARTMASVLRSLRPGGRLVVIDFERIPGTTAQWLLDHVRAGKDVFRAEIESAGFQFLGEKKSLVRENYFLLFRKPAPPAQKPNFVIIFADDLGYGDLASYGNPVIRTPRLDRMAAEGQRWTQFYAAAPVCTPSRAALLTGRLPVRSGMCSSKQRVLFGDSTGGLPDDELTLAAALRTRGYATMAVGKWHLGHLPQYLPTARGFDAYFGIPYSNDMDKDKAVKADHIALAEQGRFEAYNVPLLRDGAILERPADQRTITRRYTEEAVKFLRARRDGKPFFLYLAHNMPHVPLFPGSTFKGRSPGGMYADVIEELDWSVGEVLDALDDGGLAGNTLVFFSSDNGPWLIFKTHGGTAGLLRDGKGCTFEGGMRVPGIFRWPGAIRPSIVRDIGSTLDIFPTFLALAGGAPPKDRTYDGFDLRHTLLDGAPGPRNDFPYYRDDTLFAWRHGSFKAHFTTQGAYGAEAKAREDHDLPVLYNLDQDPSERFDVAPLHPDVIAEIRRLADAHRAGVRPVPNQLETRPK